MIVVIIVGIFATVAAALILWLCCYLFFGRSNLSSRWMFVICSILSLAIGIGSAMFFANTESGKAAIKDQKSGMDGLKRILRVYTADGTLIAEYDGKFNINDNNGGIMFNYDGKRHIYWNCFIESIEK